ncbi:MAG: hypothetical protein K0U52_10710, partial [Gammaproteobacteria bacterium]|nr:hypothetical protein [Gammaproteobacteria bacterium]
EAIRLYDMAIEQGYDRAMNDRALLNYRLNPLRTIANPLLRFFPQVETQADVVINAADGGYECIIS